MTKITESSRPLKVVSYNIHRCIGVDGRYDPDRIAAVLAALDADVIALQEVDSNPEFCGGIDQFEFMAGTLGYDIADGPAIRHTRGCYGNAVLTRGKILGIHRHDLSCPKLEPRVALDVELEVRGLRLRMVNTHLGLRPGERMIQITRILEHLPLHPEHPVILAGDINEWNPVARTLRLLGRRFGRSPRVKSFPSRFPLFCLDRIWVTPEQALQSVEVHLSPVARAASDHLPVMASICVDTLGRHLPGSRAQALDSARIG